jgi:hypothetical protein
MLFDSSKRKLRNVKEMVKLSGLSNSTDGQTDITNGFLKKTSQTLRKHHIIHAR